MIRSKNLLLLTSTILGLILISSLVQSYYPGWFYECDNGIDDDGDGFVDWQEDPGCFGANDWYESEPSCPEGYEISGVDYINLRVKNPDYVIESPFGEFFPSYVELTLPQEYQDGTGLVNGFDLEAGKYIAQIGDGSFSRWNNDNEDSSRWGGAPGLTWESTANVVYNEGGVLKFYRLSESFFATAREAEEAGFGKSVLFDHDGGNFYSFIDDGPIEDNRGHMVLELYKCNEVPPVIECYEHKDCDDGNDYTQDVCYRKGTPEAYCENHEIACLDNSDCGETGFGNYGCYDDNLYRSYIEHTCYNPGTSASGCGATYTPVFQNKCNFKCQVDSCVNECVFDFECDDGNILTKDSCVIDSIGGNYCKNDPIDVIECYNDLDCNDNDDYTVDICKNPGTKDSYCSYEVLECLTDDDCKHGEFCNEENICKKKPIPHECLSDADCDDNDDYTKDSCVKSCTGNYCKYESIACLSDSDCDDENSKTRDKCINEGTPEAYCKNTKKDKDNGDGFSFLRLGECYSVWECSDWGECVDGVKRRTCEDVNYCDSEIDKPIEISGCEIVLEEEKVDSSSDNWVLFWLALGILVLLILIIVVFLMRG